MLGKKAKDLSKKQILRLASKEINKNKISKLKRDKEILFNNLEKERKKTRDLNQNIEFLKIEKRDISDSLYVLRGAVINQNEEILKLNKNIADLESELNDEVQISISSNKNYYDKKIELEEFKSSNKQLLKQLLSNLIRRV